MANINRRNFIKNTASLGSLTIVGENYPSDNCPSFELMREKIKNNQNLTDIEIIFYSDEMNKIATKEHLDKKSFNLSESFFFILWSEISLASRNNVQCVYTLQEIHKRIIGSLLLLLESPETKP